MDNTRHKNMYETYGCCAQRTLLARGVYTRAVASSARPLPHLACLAHYLLPATSIRFAFRPPSPYLLLARPASISATCPAFIYGIMRVGDVTRLPVALAAGAAALPTILLAHLVGGWRSTMRALRLS